MNNAIRTVALGTAIGHAADAEAGPMKDRGKDDTLNAALLGKRVKLGLDKGRAVAIAQAQEKAKTRAKMILAFATADILAGQPSRGRAGRIHRKMVKSENISQLTVWRYLQKYSFSLSSVKDSQVHDVTKQEASCALTL